jgi:hypothetical protein
MSNTKDLLAIIMPVKYTVSFLSLACHRTSLTYHTDVELDSKNNMEIDMKTGSVEAPMAKPSGLSDVYSIIYVTFS